MLAAVSLAAMAMWVTTAWLLGGADDAGPGSDRVRVRVDAVRTGLAASAAVGAAVTLMLAFRRQRHQEIATALSDHDATERRITELYNAAAEQLGSDKAPVRLTALYTLERLGNDNPSHRQTIVNIICAYLRMPYPARLDNDDAEEGDPGQDAAGGSDPQEERQVRLTAQRLLSTHLRPDAPVCWGRLSLDLTGATLIDLALPRCVFGSADFSDATFVGPADLSGAVFIGPAEFGRASFTDDAVFVKASFIDHAIFRGAKFDSYARFKGATFGGDRPSTITAHLREHRAEPKFYRITIGANCIDFGRVTFANIADFTETSFAGEPSFMESKFTDAFFYKTSFTSGPDFHKATFTHHAEFNDATVVGGADFSEASLTDAHFNRVAFTCPPPADLGSVLSRRDVIFGGAYFANASFSGRIEFDDADFGVPAYFKAATFDSDVTMRNATVIDTQQPHALPPGWHIEPTEGTAGHLAPDQPADAETSAQ